MVYREQAEQSPPEQLPQLEELPVMLPLASLELKANLETSRFKFLPLQSGQIIESL